MKSIVTRLTAAAAAAGAALPALLCSAPAAAAPASYTAFYPTSGFPGTPRVITHLSCDGQVTFVQGHFSATDNRPLPGCLVQVYTNATPVWVTLCAGRAELPLRSRLNPEVRSVPGSSRICL